MKSDSFFTSYIKINSKGTADLDLKRKMVKFLEDVTGNYLLDFGIEPQIRKKKTCKPQKKAGQDI